MTDLSLMMVTGDILGLPLFWSVFVVESFFHFYVSLQQKEVGTCLPPVLCVCVCVCACASTCKCPAGLPFSQCRYQLISSSLSITPREEPTLQKAHITVSSTRNRWPWRFHSAKSTKWRTAPIKTSLSFLWLCHFHSKTRAHTHLHTPSVIYCTIVSGKAENVCVSVYPSSCCIHRQ